MELRRIGRGLRSTYSGRLFRAAAAFLLLGAVLPTRVAADEIPTFTDQQLMHFQEVVVPVLEANCLKCHAGEHPKGGLDLTTRSGILTGGESGAAVDLDDPEYSPLLLAINYDGYEMPPSGQLRQESIAALTQWVQDGLAWPSDLEQLEAEPEAGPPEVNDESRQFWSFVPPQKPRVPAGHDWAVNEIDSFIAARLQAAGVTPSEQADPRELVRRVHYDLLGLPPSQALVEKFAADPSDQAWGELIDSLLSSPHYGEHWGRHWLDLVRYAETNSYERDGAKPHVWRYRDYVIRAFNDDKPYDQFIREQLAGDEISPQTPDGMIATGFYRLGRWDDEPADPLLAVYDDLDDIVTTTSQTFLGLTVNCARCHDHKIDPIPQADYYRMLAFFRHVRRYGVRSGDSVDAASVREINRPEDPARYEELRKRHAGEMADAERRLRQIEEIVKPDFEGVEHDEFQYEMNRVALIEKREGTLLKPQQVQTYRRQTQRLKELRANPPRGLAKALCVSEDVSRPLPSYILTRGNPHVPGQEVTPGFPSVLSPPEITVPEVTSEAATSGRRSLLADWIASPANPLTSRVMVNRIWQYHFGRGIVRSSSDFGFQGTAPTHPQLLDWLATTFAEDGWSIKSMHRRILMSRSYRMSSRPRKDCYDQDPLNDLFWRFDMRRLAAEEIRDSILWASGELNLNDLYGPSIYTDIPDEVKAGQSRPGSGWGNSPPDQRSRRSVYIHVKRSLLDPLLESFDFADTDLTCPVRFVTTQPTQALGMMNSDFIRDRAAQFTASLERTYPDDANAQVAAALRKVTQRPVRQEEIRQGVELMAALKSEYQFSQQEALQAFCLVALNLNEFLYLD